MFIELVEVLRCTSPHAETYLVAAPVEMRDRNIHMGTLGCPVCHAEFPVIDGVVHFAPEVSRPPAPAEAPSEYEVLRGAALLDLQGSHGFAVLFGEWGTIAPSLAGEGAPHLVLINPPHGVESQPGLSILLAGAVLPLAQQRSRGVALDADAVARHGSDAGAALVASGGRLVAPATAAIPSSARMLASDDRDWVAEVSHAPLATISISRKRS